MAEDEETEDRRKYNPGRPKGTGKKQLNAKKYENWKPGQTKPESEKANQATGKSRGRPKKDAQE